MKRFLALLCVAALCLSAFAGLAVAEEKTKVVIWTNSRADYDYVLPCIEKFNETNESNIEIVYEVYSDNYQQVLELGFETGNGPDLYCTSGPVWSNVTYNGQGRPLNDMLTEEQYAFFGGEKAFVNTINMKDGDILSLPYSISTPRLVYNKDIFERAGIEKVPETFEEVIATAKTITEKLSGEGIYGFAINLKGPASALGRTLDYMMGPTAGLINGYNFKTGRYEFDKVTEIVAFLRQMFADGSAFPGCDQLDIDPLRTQFAAGRIGMYYSYTGAEYGVYTNQFVTDVDWDFGPLTGNGTRVGLQNADGGKWYAMSIDTKVPEAAFEVLSYLESLEVLSGSYEQGLHISMIDEVIKNSEVPAAIQAHPLMAKQETDGLYPIAPTGVAIEGEDYYNVFAGHILGIPGYEDLDALAQDLNARYNAALDKGIADGTVKEVVYPNFDPMNPAGSMN
ncbi:MAG: carbohydrate ABC transporter substrate-binding protein [Clostridia bacterium]|nr:carbohydrate ABC transporter substrate-binding protein [Clostridia bacterium]